MSQKLPHHVAIVMDGNGRWAESRGLIRVEGHSAGTDVVKAMVKSCLEKNIAILSLFAFSSENWSRPENEVDFLMQLFVHALESEIDSLHANGVRLCFIGDRSQLSETLRQSMCQSEQMTENNQRLILNIAVNYSGKWDILQATRSLANSVKRGELLPDNLDEAVFASRLSTSQLPDPDLFIRTSGELRISNFFLWQLAYTELYFSNLHWPDFTMTEFEKALESYSVRERRFGQTSKQSKEKNHV